ncbi:MAG: DNA polymerase III subunit delta [Magnetovibrio sp.]|nr:DNA polymerase III subunit delta [Magnetovibrio sp.]
MKLKGAKIEAFLRSPDPSTRAILIFGPDEGLVQERAMHLCKGVLQDLNDPFRVAELFATDLKNDPARLADEAQSISFGGGQRLVRVRQASDLCVLACEGLLHADVVTDTVVIIDAGDLNPRSKLRKLFETAKNAVCLPCYSDDARTLPNIIKETLTSHGLTADRDAVFLLAQHLGADRSVTRGELHKLALYMGDDKQVTSTHVQAVIGDTAANNVDDVIYAAASGNFALLDSTLSRVLADGTNPVQLVRACQRHFHRLSLARGEITRGLNVGEAVKALRPPVMFMRADAFKAQLNVWSSQKLVRAFEVLTQCEIDCKTTGLPAAAVTGRAFLALAQAAQSGRPARRRSA